MKIAIITGASSGLGRELALRVSRFFPEIEACWLISRREDRLVALAKEIARPVCEPMGADLLSEAGFSAISARLSAEKPDIRLLINCAGAGYLGAFDQSNLSEQTMMIDLNVRALTTLTHMALPYMAKGARILNIASIASFSPNANMAVYSATKAYVRFFSVALSDELKARGITATAVNPAPMDTEFLSVGRIKGNSKRFDTMPWEPASEVAEGALNACVNGKREYTPRLFYKTYRLLSRILPTGLLLRIAKT